MPSRAFSAVSFAVARFFLVWIQIGKYAQCFADFEMLLFNSCLLFSQLQSIFSSKFLRNSALSSQCPPDTPAPAGTDRLILVICYYASRIPCWYARLRLILELAVYDYRIARCCLRPVICDLSRPVWVVFSIDLTLLLWGCIDDWYDKREDDYKCYYPNGYKQFLPVLSISPVFR